MSLKHEIKNANDVITELTMKHYLIGVSKIAHPNKLEGEKKRDAKYNAKIEK